MIEKLSDKARDNMAAGTENYTCGLPLVRAIIQSVCDYYDAQIDKQAKTMDDLLYAFFSSKIDKSTIDWCKKRDLHMSEVVRVHFSMYVSFFLAAGGTIKDGE